MKRRWLVMLVSSVALVASGYRPPPVAMRGPPVGAARPEARKPRVVAVIANPGFCGTCTDTYPFDKDDPEDRERMEALVGWLGLRQIPFKIVED